MTKRLGLGMAVLLVATLAACGGGGGDGGTPPVRYVLTVTPPTNGTITLSPSGGTYDAGTVVTVTAAPASGFLFDGWTGALSGTTNPTTVTMDAAKTVGATFSPTVVPECDKAANVAKKAELVAAQPVLTVKASSGKTVKTFTTTFASVAGNPSEQCPVDLQFKDLNGDSALQPYEDWTKTADARATDLAGRMSAAQKLALMAHAITTDVPTAASSGPSAATNAIVDAGLRFAETTASTAQLTYRATWANGIQERCEASAFGIPFVLSMEPAHAAGNGRVKAKGYSQWPYESALGATGDLALVKTFGQTVSQELRAIGVRMALEVSADLATDPRWWGSQFSFGENSAAVADMVGAYVNGLQGDALGATSVAAVVGHFPGAGAAGGGFDSRFAKGKSLAFTGTNFDAHAGAFQKAFDRGVAGVMPAYGVPATGAWTGLSGLVTGASIEQVGASFNAALLTDVLRGHYSYGGLVVAPAGVLENAGLAPFGAPWGMEGSTRAQRITKAVGAGVDQFVGLNDATDLTAAALEAAKVDAAAKRALKLIFQLGLFENAYIADPTKAASFCNTPAARGAGLDAMNRGLVLLHNADKPTGWLNGAGNGTQTGDKGNAGNGSMKVLPAPPGEPYVSPGCDYYVAGDFDLVYVNSVSEGYGTLTNDASIVKGINCGASAACKMALSDFIFVRIAAPYTADTDTGSFEQALSPLTYAGNDPAVLGPVQTARNAINAWTGPPASQAQIIVFVDSGRPSVMSELLAPALGVSGLYLTWMGRFGEGNADSDKVALDVAFGIVNGRGTLPVGLPASDAAAGTQVPDVAGDGQDATLVRGFGIQTNKF